VPVDEKAKYSKESNQPKSKVIPIKMGIQINADKFLFSYGPAT